MPRKNTDAIATVGIDIGKNTFHLIGLDKRGAIVMQARLSRRQLGRMLEARGHDVRLIPAQYVKPFLKEHKNDCRGDC